MEEDYEGRKEAMESVNERLQVHATYRRGK